MQSHVRQLIVDRAGEHCEYCRIAQSLVPFHTFHIEHIVARQHGGTDDLDNLCLACDRCNAYKGSNLTGIDPESNQIALLFHPRRESWTDHFALRGPEIIGLTPSGRATARLLKMNDCHRVSLRAELIATGDLPGPAT
jgi:hypothetical protein